MKAFVAAIIALIAITIGADFALDRAGFSAGEVYKKSDVRLD